MSIIIKGITIDQFNKDTNKIPYMDVGWDIEEIPDPKVFAARMELAKCYYPKDTIAETLRGRLDPEMSHISADRLMCELLETLGYGEAVKIFEEMEKWYS